MLTRFIAIALVTLLAACEDAETQLKFGAKNFGESRVLAHMMAELAGNNGLPVAGVIDYESTQAIQEALKRGDIDAYPEYNGTGLVMLGQNPMTDGEAATARVKELYEPLGFSWRAKFGFANNYGIAMRPERATELGVTTMSELVSRASQLTLGVEDDFVRRPLDGLTPMVQRYGFDFGETVDVPLSDRAQLYDRLLEGEFDAIEVYTTDGQIADYGLVILEDDLGFFPVYEGSAVARSAALSVHQGLGAVLDSLGGKIDGVLMQELNRKVDIEGRAPGAVAREALAQLGLIEAAAVDAGDPLIIAASPDVGEGAAANAALRAARDAFTGRNIQIKPTASPLEAVAAEEARLALVSADAFFDLSGVTPQRDERFEAVAAVSQNLLHIVARQSGPVSLSGVETFVTYSEGSSSHSLAEVLAKGLDLSAQLRTTEASTTADLLAALGDGAPEAAIVFAPEGDRGLVSAMAVGGFRLLSITGWEDGANLLTYPFLRTSRISGDVYAGQFGATETLASQLVLAGPAPQETGDIVGNTGPSAVAVAITPISGDAVAALNASISGAPLIDPTLRQAASLLPALPEPPASINPSADISILNLFVVALLVWLAWLFVRPEYR